VGGHGPTREARAGLFAGTRATPPQHPLGPRADERWPGLSQGLQQPGIGLARDGREKVHGLATVQGQIAGQEANGSVQPSALPSPQAYRGRLARARARGRGLGGVLRPCGLAAETYHTRRRATK